MINNNPAESADKPAVRSKATKMLSFLSKNVKSVNFQNLPFSPGRDKRAHAGCGGKGFSGPIISMIPAKSKSGRRFDADQEPTSPKISCMGQIKHKKKSKAVAPRPPKNPPPQDKKEKNEQRKARRPKSASLFSGTTKPARKSADDAKSEGGAPPGLGGMKKFASSRDGKLAEFVWNKDYSSEEEEDEVLVPHSAPIMIGGGRMATAVEPRSEINLWKRRTMDPPKPLQLNTMRS